MPPTMEDDKTEVARSIRAYKKWYHKFEVLPGVITDGEQEIGDVARYLSDHFNIRTLKGKRILDVAAFDGGWTFGFEKLGADVTAIDVIDESRTGFSVARAALGSRAKFFNISAYDLDPEIHGTFDMVHFSWSHYRLKNPFLALEKVASVMRKDAPIFGHGVSAEYYHRRTVRSRLLEWMVRPMLRRLPLAYCLDGDGFEGDPTNWIMFNDRGLRNLLERAGFLVEYVKSNTPRNFGPNATVFFKGFKLQEADEEFWPDNPMVEKTPEDAAAKKKP